MSPRTVTLPLRKPKMSSFSLLNGTSLATGLPRLVMTTGSRFDATSSMTLRQWTLNRPAGIVFIGGPFDHGRYTHGRGAIPPNYRVNDLNGLFTLPIAYTRESTS